MSGIIQINYPDPGFWTATSMIQLGYGVWVNLSMVTIGLAYGFSAVALPQLSLPESLVKVTIADESWIGECAFNFIVRWDGNPTQLERLSGLTTRASVISLASPVGCVLCGYLIDKFGRRTMIIYSQLPVCVGWLYTGIASSAKHIILGRIITGVGLGMVMCVPRVYMTEVSLPNMRGVIGSFPNIAMSLGLTMQAALGSMLRWPTLCYVGSAYTISLFLMNFCLPETPYYLLQKTSIEDAQVSLKKFRSKKYNIEAEMEELIDFKNENDIHK
ncbi:facilitated trehalose transporter Tret1-like [Vanessa tameamea]|uniref:Facilitated trehalose transporter Tret1-like n=1 Tax=Vanessa tameamea TaxID=334116 RepID=A0ABM4AIV3_VANTA